MGIRLLFILLILMGHDGYASVQNNAIATAHPLATQAGETMFLKGVLQ